MPNLEVSGYKTPLTCAENYDQVDIVPCSTESVNLLLDLKEAKLGDLETELD